MVKNLPVNVGDMGFIYGLGRSPGEGNGNPLHYSCLGNLTEELAWRATAHGVSQIQLSMYAYILCKSTWTEAEISSLPKITGTASGIRIQKQSQFSNN